MTVDLTALKRRILVRFLIAVPVLGLMLFLPAGTLRYRQAWMFMAVTCFTSVFIFLYFVRQDPEFLESRLRTKEKVSRQKWLMLLAIPTFLATFLLPGFDRRFGWSSVPVAIEIAAAVLVLAGYLLVFFVFKENRYASRIIEIQKDQRVIRTGPYAVVRHPMYVGTLMMYLSAPIALGSWWALLPILVWPVIIVFRIRNEENILSKELDGYEEYSREVKYRLLPGIW